MKTCFKCGKTKSINEFYGHPKMADGRLGKCKDCTKKDVKKNYRNNIDHYVEYYKKRESTQKRKEQRVNMQRRYRDLNPEKYKARNIVSNALRDKIITRKNCEICGSIESEAHHADYSKPLDVKWLCFSCHRAEHGQETRSPEHTEKRNDDQMGLFSIAA